MRRTAISEVARNSALTWAEWCAWQQDRQRLEQRRHDGMPFTDRELAHLSFVRWLYQTGRLDTAERAGTETPS